jgi:peptidoglycan/xylan/chitin deacetylase (PgdA/CDA1 family)
MHWHELSELAADPLVTIGAHTVNHPRLRTAREAVARHEMAESASRIEAVLGIRPAHFAYPFGDPTSAGPREFALARELGFKTAVTTRPGVLFPEHREHLTALPRISLNGEFQRLRYLRVLTSGAATALWNRFRRVDAA